MSFFIVVDEAYEHTVADENTQATPTVHQKHQEDQLYYSNTNVFIVTDIHTCAPAWSRGICAASVSTGSLFSLLLHLCCAADCLPARLSACLPDSVADRPLLAFVQHMHIHDGSGSFHVEMCARAFVCV